MHKKLEFLKKINRNQWLIGIVLVGVLATGGLIWAHAHNGFSLTNFSILGMSDQAIGKKAVDYINSNGLSSTPATLVSVSRESGLIKVTIKIGTNQFDSYATPDGKLLFPQALQMNAAAGSTPSSGQAASQTPAATATTPANIVKTDTPMLEAYVVADCPYGLQMQRAISQAIATQPALAKYITVRYIGSASGSDITSMHDSGPNGAEAEENLRQVCIRDEQPAKYWSYVSCYMQKQGGSLPNSMPIGDSPSCLASTGVDTAKVNACMADPTRGLADINADFALDTKYGVQGSPTLVLDGQTIDETSFGGRSPDGIQSMVCAAFTTAPSFCSTKLDTTQAATSFSTTYAGSGSSSSAADCAPAS